MSANLSLICWKIILISISNKTIKLDILFNRTVKTTELLDVKHDASIIGTLVIKSINFGQGQPRDIRTI